MERQRKTRRSFNLAQKLEIIELYENHNRDFREIARNFSCSFQTIQNIIRHKDEHLEDWANNADLNRVRYRPNNCLRSLHFIVYEWVRRCRFYPMRITDQLIKQKGEEAAYYLGIVEQHKKTGSGWVSRFKEKFKLANTDLMNPDRIEAAMATNAEKQSLDIESIVTEVREHCGQIVDQNTVRRKRDNVKSQNHRPDSSPSSASYDNSREVVTIDLTESIHSDDSGHEDGDADLLVPISYTNYRTSTS